MRKRLLLMLVFLLGVLCGALSPAPVAQTAQRLFGTFSDGSAKAVLVDSSGRLRVVGS